MFFFWESRCWWGDMVEKDRGERLGVIMAGGVTGYLQRKDSLIYGGYPIKKGFYVCARFIEGYIV